MESGKLKYANVSRGSIAIYQTDKQKKNSETK